MRPTAYVRGELLVRYPFLITRAFQHRQGRVLSEAFIGEGKLAEIEDTAAIGTKHANVLVIGTLANLWKQKRLFRPCTCT